MFRFELELVAVVEMLSKFRFDKGLAAVADRLPWEGVPPSLMDYNYIQV